MPAAMSNHSEVEIKPYEGPMGDRGSVVSLARHVSHHAAFGALAELPRQNKVDGYACVSCAWAKPANARTWPSSTSTARRRPSPN